MTFQETVNQALARLASPSIEVEREQSQAVKDASILQWAEAYIRQSNELENFLPRPAGMEPRKGINFPLADFATELRREITEWLKI